MNAVAPVLSGVVTWPQRRKCSETIYRVSSPEWQFPELAKGVAREPCPSQAQGRATRKAVNKNCTLSKYEAGGQERAQSE